MSSPSDTRPVVIDNGSQTCKAGFAGDQNPTVIVNSFNGIDPQTNDVYISNDAYSKADILNLKYPINHRIITNWEDMEKIWNYIFTNQLHIESSSHPILLTDDTLNTKENREQMIQIMFEKFNVPLFYVAKQSVLSLYSAGRLNGVVLDSGDSATLATPIYGGYYITNTAVPMNIGGSDVTSTLQKFLNERGYHFTSFSQREIVRDIKEKHCYLSSNFEQELQKEESFINYSLPDGNAIKIGREIFQSSEILFKPQMNGFDCKGIDQILFESIEKCDPKIHKELYSSIVISGGTTKLNQFHERIEKEMIKHASAGVEVNVVEPHRRQYASWIGGSIFASLPTFKDMMVSSQEYNESGSNIVRKCP